MAPSDNRGIGQPAPSGRMFEVETIPRGDDLCLRLSGELDLASLDKLRDAIGVAEASKANKIVVDLGDLEFMDSTGLGVLLQAYTQSRRNGQRLRFAPSKHNAVTELIALTGTKEIFG